jgi:opacity protein-like surface antigen
LNLDIKIWEIVTLWRIEPELSIGLGYMFSNHIDIHAAYTYIGGANDQPIVNVRENGSFFPKAKVYSTNMLMAGISYTF